LPKLDEEMEDTQKIFEDPSYIREMQKKQDQAPKRKQHIVGLVSQGHILGIEEPNFGYSKTYNTGAICKTLKAELYYIEKEFLSKMLMQNQTIWDQIQDKSSVNYSEYCRSIKNMEKSNLKIIDTMRRETNEENTAQE